MCKYPAIFYFLCAVRYLYCKNIDRLTAFMSSTDSIANEVKIQFSTSFDFERDAILIFKVFILKGIYFVISVPFLFSLLL